MSAINIEEIGASDRLKKEKCSEAKAAMMDILSDDPSEGVLLQALSLIQGALKFWSGCCSKAVSFGLLQEAGVKSPALPSAAHTLSSRLWLAPLH